VYSHLLRVSCSTENQHSTKFTAIPPRLVSLCFDRMSAPVWRMVATTLSSETRWRPSPCSATDAAAIAFTAYIFLPKTRDGLMIEGLWN
jgi:hypothetical protein